MLRHASSVLWVIALVAILTSWCYAQLGSPSFAKAVKASLIFEQSPDEPSHLHVLLHLVNQSDQTLKWSMDPVMGLDAELFDPSGKPAELANGMAMEIMSGPKNFTLAPYGKLDVLISHSWGISVGENSKGRYFVEIADKLWFVPTDTVSGYTLHVRLQAGAFQPGRETSPPSQDWPEVPPQKVVFTPLPH